MSQKFIKKKQTSPKSLGYGKYYAKAVYNQKHITTRQLADFIQTQASVKRSDCIAVLDELGDITFEEATDYEAPKVASSNQGGGTNQGGSNTGGDNLGQN